MTTAAGITNANFGTSAAWLDYDKDGKLDLFVANYVQWSRDRATSGARSTAPPSPTARPESYKGTASKLYRNLGGGKFEDVSQKAGVADPNSKSLGVAVLDYNGDGWPDLFVANDTQPNKLYRNNSNGTFTEDEAWRPASPSARTASRAARWASTPRTTTARAVRTCWSATSRTRCSASITTRGTACSWTRRRASTVGRASLLTLAFGVFFFDYDLDGQLDILAANGHHRRRDRPRAAEGAVPAAAAPVPQPGPGQVRDRDRRHGRGLQPSHRGARRGLRRSTTTTATSTSSSPPITARPTSSATTAATATTGSRCRPWAPSPTATASAPWYG